MEDVEKKYNNKEYKKERKEGRKDDDGTQGLIEIYERNLEDFTFILGCFVDKYSGNSF